MIFTCKYLKVATAGIADLTAKKTEVIFFGNKSRLKKLDNKTVKYLGTPLECKKEAKYLGVIFDEKMQWSSQISNITKKVNFQLKQNKICCIIFDISY